MGCVSNGLDTKTQRHFHSGDVCLNSVSPISTKLMKLFFLLI